MDQPFKMSQTRSGDVDLVVLSGTIDMDCLDDFQDMLSKVSHRRPARAILDCTKVTYINAKALNLISHYHRTAWLNMGRITFVGLQKKIARSVPNFKGVPHAKIFDATLEEAYAEIATVA